MIDVNCHLQFDSLWVDRAEVWQRARVAGVQHALVSSDVLTDSRIERLQHFSEAGLSVAAGWHPLFPAPADALDRLARVLDQHPGWGVGEVGLDTRQSTAEAQSPLLQDQLAMAVGRFCVLHAVGPGALDAAYRVARGYPGLRGAVHAFSGSVEQARQWVDLGWYLSIGGPVTRPGATRLARWVEAVPLDHLLLESDAPDLAPVNWKGLNEPASLAAVCARVAQIRQIDGAAVAEQTTANAIRWLGLSGHRLPTVVL